MIKGENMSTNKLSLVVLTISLLALPSLACLQLDGTTFCRKVESDGMFGQHRSVRQHCVSFSLGKMTDNANTFFGNPPETLPYHIENENEVVVYRDGNPSVEYKYENASLINSQGAVLTFTPPPPNQNKIR
jgi:hypothetical protein